jgi:anti-sigma regulatory factor (Ser/Thr protein kinase)
VNRVAAPLRLRVRLAASADAPARARDAVGRLAGAVDCATLATLALVASELVTNAVRHSGAAAGEPLELEVLGTDRSVRLAVSDPGRGFDAAACAPAPGALGGWGLYLVGELVDRWWVDGGPPTRVVAELATAG